MSIWENVMDYFDHLDKTDPWWKKCGGKWTGPTCQTCGQPITDYKHMNKKYCSTVCRYQARKMREVTK